MREIRQRWDSNKREETDESMEREEKIKWMKAKQGKERRNYEDMKNRWDLGEKEVRSSRNWEKRGKRRDRRERDESKKRVKNERR